MSGYRLTEIEALGSLLYDPCIRHHELNYTLGRLWPYLIVTLTGRAPAFCLGGIFSACYFCFLLPELL